MNYVKLQIGCLCVVLYVISIYLKYIRSEKVEVNHIFNSLLVTAPIGIIFDGITAWTVNHMDIVPANLNLIFHGIFFISYVLSLALLFFFILDYTVGMPKRKWVMVLIHIPSGLAIILTLVWLKDLYYIEGKITNYSMGKSVYACYISMFIHFSLFAMIIFWKRRTIEKRKLENLIIFMLSVVVVITLQIIFPEILLTSLMPTLMILCLYINILDPAMIRLEEVNAEMVTAFATLVENRDSSTGGHIIRTQKYVRLILQSMVQKNKYAKFITQDYISDVIQAAPMHDIGKITIPDSILQKPGKLTDEEFEMMKTHAPKGGDIILETFNNIDDVDFKQISYEVARYHHEKWNGKGYPEGLKGEEIPLHARIMAIADVFDAVSVERCYRKAMTMDECFQIIENGKGTDFDPELAQIFLDHRAEVEKLYYEEN